MPTWKILEEVLKATKLAEEAKNKEKAAKNGENSVNETGLEKGLDGDKKRKAESSAGDEPGTKKAKNHLEPNKNQNHSEPNTAEQGKPKETLAKGQIWEYPDYEANREEDFYEEGTGNFHTSMAGNQTAMSDERHHGGAETSRHEHEVSSEEEDDIKNYHDPHDDIKDDFLGDEAGWDSRSIASSAIFPSQSKRRGRQDSRSGVRPESGRPRSRSVNKDDGVKNSGSPTTGQTSNPIEDLVKQRVGVEGGKEAVGPR